jgi:hypothetical protein
MLSSLCSELVEGHFRVDSKSRIEPFCGDMQKPLVCYEALSLTLLLFLANRLTGSKRAKIYGSVLYAVLTPGISGSNE